MMTKEAKVGLLLGLVFIVAIAVVLKGVGNRSPRDIPSLLPDSSKSLAYTGTQLNALSSTIHLATSGSEKRRETVPPLKNDNNALFVSKQRPENDNVHDAQTVSGVAKQALVKDTVRQGNHVAVNRQNIATPISPLGDSEMETIRHRTSLPNVSLIKQSDYQAENGRKLIERQVVHKRTNSKKPKQKVYYIKKGESLSDVALIVYGPVEGKRWVNVQKIYKANTRIIPSMDVVTAGLKVIIPPLPNPQSGGNDHKQIKIATPKSKKYMVKEGDSLWLISKKLLGKGKRYNEIIKLNKQLRSDKALRPGMKINIPH